MAFEPPSSPDEILRHYERGLETGRLYEKGQGEVERVRTLELLRRHLPPPPARILDVGGGPGVYAVALAELGYEVDLIDVTPLHVEQARESFAQRGLSKLATASVGDARSLARPSASFNAVLLLGPLYHLPEKADRIRALEEARRVTLPGGLVFAAGISRFASLLEGLISDRMSDPSFVRIVGADLDDGHHRNPDEHPNYFTTAYFHTSEELEQEVKDVGFEWQELVAIEGPLWMSPHLEKQWEDPAQREALLHLLRTVEHERTLIGMSAHLMVVARVPRGHRTPSS